MANPLVRFEDLTLGKSYGLKYRSKYYFVCSDINGNEVEVNALFNHLSIEDIEGIKSQLTLKDIGKVDIIELKPGFPSFSYYPGSMDLRSLNEGNKRSPDFEL